MKRVRECISPRQFSRVVLIIATLIVVVLIQGPALGQVLKPGKTPIPQGLEATEEDKIATQKSGPPERVSILVHMTPGADRMPMQVFVNGKGASVKYRYKKVLPNVINVRNFPTSALNGLLAIPGVERWEEDGTVHMHLNDSTPLINALQSQISAAGLSATGAGVRVCVLDTGIDGDHIMYETRIDTDAGRDFVNNDNNPEDDEGHGSHVAGIVVGTGLSVDFGCVGSEPFQGVAPEATLIGIKVLDASGSGSFSDVIAGINYGADQSASGGRCDVMNLSLGGGLFTGTCDGNSAAAAANNAVANGVVVVASSGNDGATNAMGTPACGSKVISVGATYDDDYPNCEFPNQSSFTWCLDYFCSDTCTDNSPSDDEIVCLSNQSDVLDVTAPGCITFSADSGNSPYSIVGFCGTSMAAPHVAGLAALLLHTDPSLTPTDVRQLIRDGAIDLGASGHDNAYGYGRIDVINSLSLVGPQCEVPADCDDGDLCTTDTCVAGTCDNTPISCPPGETCNENNGVCEPQVCDNDGNCEAGEDCNSCPNDCRQKTTGKPNSRYCCDGDLPNCGDPRCSEEGWICGDSVCISDFECNDGQWCNGSETCADGSCQGGSDPCPGQGCDEASDACVACFGNKAQCSDNSDCCSNRCKDGTCRGN